jgi:hypothetical protein
MSDRKKRTYLPPIPDGHQIYADRLEVRGVAHRKMNAVAFVSGKRDHALELEREPSNKYDPNAIKIFGVWRGWFLRHRVDVGYVPREVAAVIAELDVFEVIRPRLARTYLSSRGFVDIYFEITGPKERAHEFKEALEAVYESEEG